MLKSSEAGWWVYGSCLCTFADGWNFTYKKLTNHKKSSACILQRLKPDGFPLGPPHLGGQQPPVLGEVEDSLHHAVRIQQAEDVPDARLLPQ